jgi:hypothetical protein
MTTLSYGTKTISSTNSVENSNGTITQTERLFTVRPRDANTSGTGGGNRGTRAYIRLLTTNPSNSLNRSSDATEGLGGGSLSSSGGPLDAAINGNNTYSGYADFFVTDVRCSLDEKLQIVETFGDGEVAYYFGRQPMLMTVSGYVFDSMDNDWFVQFLTMYGRVLRGTELAKNYELVKLVLPNMYVIGSFTHVDWAQNSQRDTDIQFTFQFMIKQLVPTAIRVAGVPVSNDAGLINFSAIPDFVTQTGINSIKSSVSSLQSLIQNPTSTSGQIASGITGLGSGLSAGINDISNYNDGSSNNSYGFTTDGSGANAFGFNTSGNSTANGASSILSSSGDTSANVFASISANLTGLRASLFSPIYGVLSSLTKLVSSAMGSVTSIFNSLTSPVRDIIRAVTDISSQAIGIVNLVTGTINNLTSNVAGIDQSLRQAIGTLENAAGTITNAPKTIFQDLGALISAGSFPVTVGFLQNKPQASLSASISGTTSKIALLNSGVKFTPQSGAFL